jgi:hypothetical protein
MPDLELLVWHEEAFSGIGRGAWGRSDAAAAGALELRLVRISEAAGGVGGR